MTWFGFHSFQFMSSEGTIMYIGPMCSWENPECSASMLAVLAGFLNSDGVDTIYWPILGLKSPVTQPTWVPGAMLVNMLNFNNILKPWKMIWISTWWFKNNFESKTKKYFYVILTYLANYRFYAGLLGSSGTINPLTYEKLILTSVQYWL